MIEIFFSAAYVLFVVNFIASSGTEALASTFKWRSKMLFRGIKVLLNDNVTGLATELYKSSLINPLSSSDAEGTNLEKALPSYIDPQAFANSIISILKLDQNLLKSLLEKNEEGLLESVRGLPHINRNEQLAKLLAGSIRRNNGDLEAIRNAIATWFELSTERIGGSYKRRTQLSNFLIALVMAVMFNVNPLPPSIAALTQVKVPPSDGTAVAVAGGINVVTPTGANGGNGANGHSPQRNGGQVNGGQANGGQANSSQGQVAAGNGGAAQSQSAASAGINAAREMAVKVSGWLITALSTLLGAPFWFSVLSLVSSVRGSGGKPEEKKETPPAPSAVAIAAPAPAANPDTSSPGTPPGPTPPDQPPAPPGGPPVT
jgi:hypothetical protein